MRGVPLRGAELRTPPRVTNETFMMAMTGPWHGRRVTPNGPLYVSGWGSTTGGWWTFDHDLILPTSVRSHAYLKVPGSAALPKHNAFRGAMSGDDL